MIRGALAALALFVSGAAAAQEAPALETWQAASPRSGPWARDVMQMIDAYETGDLARLVSLIESNKPKFAQRYGRASPAFAEAVMLEALVLWEIGRDRESLPVFREAARHYEAALGSHRDVALALTTYADALVATYPGARLSEAEGYYRRSLAMRLEVLPASAPELVASRVDLADTLLRRFRVTPSDATLSEARALAEEAVRLATPAMDEEFIQANVTLADILVQSGAPANGEEVLRTALNRLSAAPTGERLAATSPLQEALIAHLESQGKTAQAELVRAMRYDNPGNDL